MKKLPGVNGGALFVLAAWTIPGQRVDQSAMLVRMSDTQRGLGGVHEAARQLALARWGTQVLDKAVDVVVTRSADLDEAQRARLAVLADGHEEHA
jgi:hypothetical protein